MSNTNYAFYVVDKDNGKINVTTDDIIDAIQTCDKFNRNTTRSFAVVTSDEIKEYLERRY